MTGSRTSHRRHFFLGLTGGFCIGLLLMQMATFLVLPPSSARTEKLVEVPRGATLRDVADILAAEDIVNNPLYFTIAAKLAGVERQIKPGEYVLNTRMRPLEVLDFLRKGITLHYEIVIPEGYTMEQIAGLLQEKEILPAEEFIRRARDPEFIRSLGLDSESLEGYLFPSTYYISKDTTADRILQRMVQVFDRVYTTELSERARQLGMTRHQVVTLASIIEKEASAESERPLVSAVFHNRLRLGMPLQSDPTVIYAVSAFDGNLKRAHLMMDSPYNTYQRRGLPPGPIANPGAASIQAALYPAPVDYLYFVSRNNGTHYFSSSIDEHNRAVAIYQKNASR